MTQTCGASITHRDDDHRQSVCVLPETHRTPHDDGEGCVWTDADHWQDGDLEARKQELRAKFRARGADLPHGI